MLLLGEDHHLVGGPLERIVLAEHQKETDAGSKDVRFVGIVRHLQRREKEVDHKNEIRQQRLTFMSSCGDMHGGVPRFYEDDDKKKYSKNF